MANGKLPLLSIQQGEDLTFENLHIGPATALIFENRDGELIDEWIGGDSDAYERMALMCYWLDEKIIRAPNPVRIAQIYKEYEDQPGEATADLLIVRADVDWAQPVAAMISRAAAITGVQHVSLAANFASTAALEQLRRLLIDTPVQSLHVTARSLSRAAEQIDSPEGPVIEQLQRDPWMPSIIHRRVFGTPPSPGSAPTIDRQLQ